ncbi:type II secretion system F family protein [Candidatus Peregrinibacteria bacterium]|nr:MAG: type II secretion system F family protein [Candidatus Peregrinibacteria bacterium]
MFRYTLQTADAFGKTQWIEVCASSSSQALALASEQGFSADQSSIVREEAIGFWADIKRKSLPLMVGKISKKDLLRFIKMLGGSLERGRTIKESLEFIGENEDQRAVQHMIFQLLKRMEHPFATQIELFGIYPDLFDDEFLGIVEAGESSSHLGRYLIDYVEEKQQQIALLRLFQTVLFKRLFTLLMVFSVALVVILFVVPQFSHLFGSVLTMPWPLRFLVSISTILQRFAPIFLLISTLVVGVFYYFVRYHSLFRFWWHDFLLRLPLIGKTLKTYYTAQFAYLLSTLLTKHVDLVRAMTIIIRQSHNVCIRSTCEQLLTRMKRGAACFRRFWMSTKSDVIISSLRSFKRQKWVALLRV